MSGDGDGSFVFALPPSLGPVPVSNLATLMAEHLKGTAIATVVAMTSYAELESRLLQGSVHAAWSPPIICARVESAGGRVALRSVRYGATTYRSVLLCRASDDIELRELGAPGGRKLRAAWVDKWSMGGYILPRYYLRSRGLELSHLFSEEQQLESYGACFDAVLNGHADLTASFAGRRGLGYVDLCGERAVELRALGYTDESPNEGIALSPTLMPNQVDVVMGALRDLATAPTSREILASAFDVNGFDEPPPGTYSALLAFLV